MKWNRERYNMSECFQPSGYREIMTILEPQHRQRPQGRLMGGASPPDPCFARSCQSCTRRGLGRAPCTVFQLTWLNGIALAHSFHPSTRCERLASLLFFFLLFLFVSSPPCPRDPKSPPERRAAWYQVLTSRSPTRRSSWDILSFTLNRSSLFLVFISVYFLLFPFPFYDFRDFSGLVSLASNELDFCS